MFLFTRPASSSLSADSDGIKQQQSDRLLLLIYIRCTVHVSGTRAVHMGWVETEAPPAESEEVISNCNRSTVVHV